MTSNPPAMHGRFVRLEPFCDALKPAVRGALDGAAADWAIMSSTGGGAAFDGWWAEAMADTDAGARRPYAIRRLADGAVVGTSSFLALKRPSSAPTPAPGP
jgi:hypothetical protein